LASLQIFTGSKRESIAEDELAEVSMTCGVTELDTTEVESLPDTLVELVFKLDEELKLDVELAYEFVKLDRSISFTLFWRKDFP
jgi:hypothetical protein